MTFFEVYRGEISALLGTVFTVIGNAVYKHASEDMDIVSLSLLRSMLGWFYVLTLALVVRNLTSMFSLSGYVILLLVLSVIFSIVIGDTMYLKAQHYVGMSRAAPINRVKTIFTLFGAYFILGEPLTEQIFLGVLFASIGVYLVTQPSKNERIEPLAADHRIRGFGLAILSALAQTGGVLTLRMGVGELDAISTQSIRYAFAFLFLGLVSTGTGSVRKIKQYSHHTLRLVAIATIFNILLGSILWVDSVKYAGAAKATTLGSTAPLFALPISMIFLRESITWKILLGTFLTITGIWLVI